MKASDNPFPSLLIEEGTEPSAPAAGHQRLYIDSTSHKLKRTDSSGTDVTIEGGVSDQGAFTYLDATEAAAPSTPASGKVRIYAKTDGRIYSLDDTGTEYGPFDAAGSGSGGRNPWEVDDPPETPDALDDEFEDSASLAADWTAFGRSADTAEVDASGKESLLHLYLSSNTGGSQLCGYYKTMPGSYPYYITTSVVATTFSTNYCRGGGIVLLDSGVTEAYYVGLVYESGRYFQGIDYSGLTTFTAKHLNADVANSQWPIRFRIKVNSATSIDIQIPEDTASVVGGTTWRTLDAGRNPGISIAKAGPGMSTEGNSSLRVVWDYFRIS